MTIETEKLLLYQTKNLYNRCFIRYNITNKLCNRQINLYIKNNGKVL